MNKKQKKNKIQKIKQHLDVQKDKPKGVVIGATVASAKGTNS